ncbi:NAD(P)-binding protein [Rhizophagus irregularis]|uniref:NAD(P)-binding protein n=1 Tax=Rhizophagus irregularis TaxID=588596 RepID=A0A2N1N135_9GLOM|nr:NAD(P)-binding protein [Rhizophagus irregularis]
MPVKLNNYDLSKHVIILTGATDGIGKEMARILSLFNPKRLILPARNKVKGNNLLEYIKFSNGHINNIEIWDMDLEDLQSIIVQNQIIKTKDNFELQFQVNHLAPFLLTLMLLDTMKKSVSAELPGKIALTSSEANKFGEIDFDNLNLEKGSYLNPFQAYGNTKLMNVLVTKELSRIVQNENITTYSLHPGVIITNINHLNRNYLNYLLYILLIISRVEITTEQGAINVLYPVFSHENKETGKYYKDGVEEEPNKVAYDQEVAKKLWDVSEKILKNHGMI